jgi:hypothetical protein
VNGLTLALALACVRDGMLGDAEVAELTSCSASMVAVVSYLAKLILESIAYLAQV